VKKDTLAVPMTKRPDEIGGLVSHIIKAEDTYAIMSAGWADVKPSTFEYKYVFDEVLYFTEGDLTLTDLDDNQSYSLKKGDVAFIGKGTNVKWATKGGVICFWCTVPPYELAQKSSP
jgi:uncharacterized cupin superfamily protein